MKLGMAFIRDDSLDRSLNGAFVPVYRRGKLVRVEHRRSDRLAIAVLGTRDWAADDLRRTPLSRRENRLDLAALDAARQEHKEKPRRCRRRAACRNRPAGRRHPRPLHPRPAHHPPVTPQKWSSTRGL
jgi:hypothetical protein